MPINRDQHISKSANPNTQKKILSFQIFQTISWTLGSPRLGLSPILCPLYSLSKFSRFFFHKLMFLLITFLFISLQLVKFTFARKSISHLYSKKDVSSLVAEKKPHHCLSLLSIVSPLRYPTNWLLGLGKLLHALLLQWINTITYNNGIKLRKARKNVPF